MSLLTPYSLLWKHRKIINAVTRSEVKVRFAGSLLGAVWLLLYPALFLGTYAMVYIFIFNVRIPEMSSPGYVILIFCGLVPFLGFSEAVSAGVGSVTSNANLIKNTMFPIELIPVRTVLAAQCTQVVGMIALIVILLLQGKLGLAVFYIPVIWALQLLFTIGLLWILSALNVFFRDINNFVPVVILMLMMISPIAYTEDMISPGLRTILYFNPLYYIIMLYQKALIFNKLASPFQVTVFVSISVVFFSLGYFMFSRLKTVFSDYV